MVDVKQWERERMARGICTKCNSPLSARSKRWCDEHLEAIRKRSKNWSATNTKLASHRSKISGHRARIRLMVKLGGLVCAWCGERDYRVLSIDHINGHDKPVKERIRTRRGLTFGDVYKIGRGENGMKDFRVLCMNCQARNEHVRGKRVVHPEIVQNILDAGGYIGEGQYGVLTSEQDTVSEEPMPFVGED